MTVRVRRGGGVTSMRREEPPVEPKRMKTNFSFRRVSEVMEGVRLQSMRSAASRSTASVSLPIILKLFCCPRLYPRLSTLALNLVKNI